MLAVHAKPLFQVYKHKFPVQGSTTLELTLAQFWSSLGTAEAGMQVGYRTKEMACKVVCYTRVRHLFGAGMQVGCCRTKEMTCKVAGLHHLFGVLSPMCRYVAARRASVLPDTDPNGSRTQACVHACFTADCATQVSFRGLQPSTSDIVMDGVAPIARV